MHLLAWKWIVPAFIGFLRTVWKICKQNSDGKKKLVYCTFQVNMSGSSQISRLPLLPMYLRYLLYSPLKSPLVYQANNSLVTPVYNGLVLLPCHYYLKVCFPSLKSAAGTCSPWWDSLLCPLSPLLYLVSALITCAWVRSLLFCSLFEHRWVTREGGRQRACVRETESERVLLSAALIHP